MSRSRSSFLTRPPEGCITDNVFVFVRGERLKPAASAHDTAAVLEEDEEDIDASIACTSRLSFSTSRSTARNWALVCCAINVSVSWMCCPSVLLPARNRREEEVELANSGHRISP